MGNMCGGEADDQEINMASQSGEEQKQASTEEYEKIEKEFTKQKDELLGEINKLLAPNKGDGAELKIHKGLKPEVDAKLRALNFYTQTWDAKPSKKGAAAKKGIKYEGNLLKKKKQGFGIQVDKEGVLYEGNWDQDVPKGLGRIIYTDGNYFEGFFDDLNMQKQGHSYYKKTGDFYGNFQGTLPHGKCMHTTESGDCFIGDYKSGAQQGNFIAAFKAGFIFNGEIKDNNLVKGKLYYKNGDIYEGEFKNNAPGG